MNILDKASTVFNAIKNLPDTMRENNTLKATLQQLCGDMHVATCMLPNTYYKEVDVASGNLKGYSYCCSCGVTSRVMSLSEVFAQELHCQSCGREINVLKHVKAVDASGKFLLKQNEVRDLLNKLPARPAGINTPQPRFLDTAGSGPEDCWDGVQDKMRNKAFETGDPGFGGMF